MACIKLSNFPSSSFPFPIPTFPPFLPYFFHSAQLSPCSPGLFIELSNSGKCFGSSSSSSSFSPAWLSIRCHCHSATLFYRFPRLCCTFFAFSPVELQYKHWFSLHQVFVSELPLHGVLYFSSESQDEFGKNIDKNGFTISIVLSKADCDS